MKSTKFKHLTKDERNLIEDLLKEPITAKYLGEVLDKDPSTISKEIKRRRTRVYNSYGRSQDYIDQLEPCPLTLRFPHVCNACESKRYCHLVKYYYRAREAHEDYLYDLSDTRKGFDTSVEELREVEELIEPLIMNGQSFQHIKINNPGIPYSVSSLYHYTNEGLFNFRNIDLSRKVIYKKRQKKSNKLPNGAKQERYYQDFLDYCAEHDITYTVQMDTVEGPRNEPRCLLTILFLPSRLMLIRLLPRQTGKYVLVVLNGLFKKLGFDIYSLLFRVCLTDNGHEFNQFKEMEFETPQSPKRSHVFFCDPKHSEQKGAIEKNHEFIRMILPKGVSMKNLTHKKVHLMETHINSYCRPALNNKAPYDVFKYTFGAEVCRLLSLNKVDPNDVILKPKLIK